VRRDERLGARRAAAGGVEVDHGDDVHRADVRVASGVRAKVDAVQRLGDPGVEGAGQDAGPACEREDGAPVVRVGVDVQDARARGGEGVADGPKRRGVGRLGDVGDREEQVAHVGLLPTGAGRRTPRARPRGP
jgi:hypothetical protein